MADLAYELRDDGVLYDLSHGVRVKVQRKSKSRQRVSMEQADVIIPPETGDLGTSTFRKKLTDLATERFGEANGLADELGLIAVAFEAHLGEREKAADKHDQETNAPELIGTSYRIVKGGIVRLKNTKEGEIPQRLTNFVARVEEEIVRDDGADVRRLYKVSGEAECGKALPRVEVPAASFGAMNWVSDAWGLSARITAGQGAKDHAREALELLSASAAMRRLYAHTGWRELPEGGRAYLHAGGAIGAEDVEVELEPGLERYTLPNVEDRTEDLARAVRVSLRFLELAPFRITVPLLSAAYLAPLSEIVVPDFALWLWGGTGSFKSTLAALVLSHFGFFSETSLPLSFESTSNALERSLFLLKDTLSVVDDWRPAVSRGDASEMDRKAQRLLRAVGNRQGRGRMTSDTTLRRSYSPRGLVLATAEALPEGPAFESAAARSLSVNLSRADVDLGCLSELQRQKDELSKAMAGYVEWIAPHYEEHAKKLPDRRDVLRNELRPELAGSHPRTPDAAAALVVGVGMLFSYAVNVGALDEQESLELFQRAKTGIVEAAKAHVETTSGGDPATRFVEVLRSLFAAGKAYARDRETGEEPSGHEDLGWEDETDEKAAGVYRPKRNADFVGWADEEHLYLDREAAYATVAGFTQKGGIPFGIKPRAVWGALKRAGINLPDEGRTDTTARVGKKSKRVVQVPRAAIFGNHDEE
ncbi:MAG: DUF927 domain-containing protein [Actinomycetota bacterium]|nr:DUF927 domain-containing protein [Actinomycetota bacterium]